MYLIVAIVTYRYAGTDVASPALGSTSPLLRKVAYGIAIPTIVIAGVYKPQPISLVPEDFSTCITCSVSTKPARTHPLCSVASASSIKEQPANVELNRRHLRPCRCQIHLRPPLPRHRPHEQTHLVQLRHLGANRPDPLDHCLDHRGGDPRLQRPTQSYLGAVCELVHVRAQWGLLAVYELGAVQGVEEEDAADGG